NVCKAIAQCMARAKLAGKILCNRAIEAILDFYGKKFNPASKRRKAHIFATICSRVLYHDPSTCEEHSRCRRAQAK
ncbi:PIPO, partial [Zucchini yellow mosaic virus]|uniref:PIPO n=1 Tax=Zucchini yellow mosaic virus TaxID=12232 RepID=UPI000264F5C2